MAWGKGVVTSLWPDVAMPRQRHSSALGCRYLSVPWSRGKGPGSACGMGLALKPAPQGSHIHPLNANTARGVSFPEVEPHRHRWQGRARVPQRLGSPAQDPTAPALPWAGSPPPPNPPLALLPQAMASTEGAGGRRRNLALLRHKLYMGERRRTEPVVESSAAGEHGALRRSQSDRSEYSQKLQGTPGSRAGCCWPCSRLAPAWPWARAQPSVPTAGPSTHLLSPPNSLKPTVHAAQQMKRDRGHERGLGVLCIMGSFSCSPAERVCRWWCEKMMPLCLFLLHEAGHALSNPKHQGQLFLPVEIIRVSNVLVCCLECASLNRNTSK